MLAHNPNAMPLSPLPDSVFECEKFTECVRHRMKFERHDAMIVLEDKYKLRQHARALGIAVPRLLACGTDPGKVIHFDNFPRSFVVKTNHLACDGRVRYSQRERLGPRRK